MNRALSIASLRLILSDGDRRDLERMRQRIVEWSGAQEGPADNVLVYVGLLRLIEHVDALEREGNTSKRSAFAKSFYDMEEENEIENDPDDRWCETCGEWAYNGCECSDQQQEEK